MRHGDKINNLGRKKAHREALLSNMASQLITHKRIVTTLAKAKALRTYIEPLVTKTKKADSKEQIMHNHRIVFSYLQDKNAVKELFTVVGPKVATRPGGYTSPPGSKPEHDRPRQHPSRVGQRIAGRRGADCVARGRDPGFDVARRMVHRGVTAAAASPGVMRKSVKQAEHGRRGAQASSLPPWKVLKSRLSTPMPSTVV